MKIKRAIKHKMFQISQIVNQKNHQAKFIINKKLCNQNSNWNQRKFIFLKLKIKLFFRFYFSES